MEEFLVKLITCFMPCKSMRKSMRHRILNGMRTFSARRRAKHFGKGSIATGRCFLSKNTFVGDGSFLGGVTVLGGGEVKIGDHVSTGPEITIQTQNHDYEGECLPYSAHKFICKSVTIDDCVWIGMNVMILPGTHIGEGAIIQMGSVVHGEIPPMAIAGGNPAKVFAWRDKEHYDALFAAGRFH